MSDAYRQFLERKVAVAPRLGSIKPDGATLRRLYLDERRGCPEIGQLYQRDASTIRLWLVQAGIETRARGTTNSELRFPKGNTLRLGKRHTPETIARVRASTIADGRVPYLRNGQHWLKGQPPSANGRWLGGATPERQEFYRSKEWKAASVIVWRRADAKCERCGLDHRSIDRKRRSFHVHHIVTFQVRELRAEPSNLALLCDTCHRWVHSKANVSCEFLRADALHERAA